MSDDYEDECEVHYEPQPVLRWSVTALLTDILNFLSGLFDVGSTFFGEQAQSMAATAAYREEARDRRSWASRVARDINRLPVTENKEHGD